MLPRSHDHSDVIGVDLLPPSQAFRVFMQDGSGGPKGKGHFTIPGMLSPDTLQGYVNSFTLQDSQV